MISFLQKLNENILIERKELNLKMEIETLMVHGSNQNFSFLSLSYLIQDKISESDTKKYSMVKGT